MASPPGPPPSQHEPQGRFDHWSAIVDGKQYTYGGYCGVGGFPTLTAVNIFDPTTELWQQTLTSGEPPPGFYGASCCVIGPQLFHFGGSDGPNKYNTIHCLNTTDLSWSATTSTHTQGAPMRKFGSAMLEHANKLVVSGGYGVLPELSDPDKYVPDPNREGRGYTNEVHCFHVDSRTWSSPEISGTPPQPSTGHSFTRVDHYRAVQFGGVQLGKLVPNHVYLLDMKSWEWTRVEASGGPGQPWPEDRTDHSAVSLHDSDSNPANPELMIMWGEGGGGRVLSDGWVFGVNVQQWRKVILPDSLKGRYWHSTTITHQTSTKKKLIHFGGLDEEPESTDATTWHPVAETTIVELECGGASGECVVTDVILSSQLGQPRENKDTLPRHVQLTLEEEMRHLTVCDRVMREKGKLTLNAVQCMMSGHPRVGKSSLLSRLTGRQPSIQPDRSDATTKESQALQARGGTNISPSTGVAERIVRVTVKKVTMVVAMATQPGLEWEQITFDVEAIGLLKSATKAHIARTFTTKPLALESATESESVPETSSASTSTPAENEAQPEKSTSLGLKAFFQFGELGVSASSTSTVPGFKAPLDIFKEALKSEKWGEVEAFLKDSLTIYFTDTGGQPEFQEVLPALISGPSLFFVVFKLIDDLNQRYRVQFVSSSQTSRPYESSFTVKEVLLQSLASIASTCSYASYTSKKMVAIQPQVVLVATHEDQASEAQIRAIQQELKETLKKTEYYRQNILVFASEDEPVFTVNNISSDGQDTCKIRSIVERIAKHSSFHIDVPLPWLVSSLAFRLLEVPVISYEQCTSIASECGIDTPDELKEALWFLHHKVGFIRYFESVPELRDVIILDPQLLFDRITELISSTFTFEQVGPHDAYQFRDIGIFPLHTIENLTARCSEYLSGAKLVKLLEHLHIIAPIQGKSGEVEKYFMPCVLSHAVPTSIEEKASSKISPLFITFRCGYCPKGVFSALIVHLMSKHNNGGAKITWRLKEDEVSRDRVTFKVGREDNVVSITTHATHLEVLVQSETQASAAVLQTSPHEVCNSIRQCIDEGIVAVSQTLHYNCDSAFYYSFYCTHRSCTKPHDHLAVCYSKDPIVMECSKSRRSCDLPDNYRIWFGHLLANKGAAIGGPEEDQTNLGVPALNVAMEPCKEEDPLGEGDFVEITDYLFELDKTHIYNLGVVLGLSHHRVKRMKDSETFLDDMVAAWLQKVDQVEVPTWQRLVKALRHKRVGQTGIASEIEKKKNGY